MPDDTLPSALNNCTAIVLAGGQSRRMGRDKASLPFADSTLLHTVIQQLQPWFSHILLSVQQPIPACDYPQISDTTPHAGPLAALVDALAHVETSWAFVTACDMPFVNPALISALAKRRSSQQAVIADIDGHWQPFAAFYAKNSLPILHNALQSGEHSLTSALRRLNPACVSAKDLRDADPALRSFIDIDTPDDWLRHHIPIASPTQDTTS